MKRTFLQISLLALLAACGSDDDKKISDLELLAGTAQKAWYMYDETPKDEDCLPTAAFKLDNSWIFFADGSFEFDPGDLTEDPECEDCCSDIINVTGWWEFTNDGKGIKITVDHEKDNPDGFDPFVMMDGSIDALTGDQLKVTQVVDGVNQTAELRKK